MAFVTAAGPAAAAANWRNSPFTPTPLWHAVARVGRRYLRFALKVEGANASGSVKDRTALSLLRALHAERPLVPGTVVVESTSGNLGVAMVRMLRERGCSFIAVVDPTTPPSLRTTLRTAGARIVVVDGRDHAGGFLMGRLAMVARILEQHPEYRWPNQYENPANPAVHAATTGPEIRAQEPGLGAVYLPVSTGGTLAGVSAHLRACRPDVLVVAVDATSSWALCPGGGRRVLGGIGSSRPSAFLGRDSFDWAVHVRDAQAIAVCRVIAKDLGMRLGGSSGSVIAAMISDLSSRWAASTAPLPVCLCADGGDRYAETLYADRWLREKAMHGPVQEAVKQYRRAGVRFYWE